MLAGCALVYWPGLYGSFLFDDFPNLKALGELGGIDSPAMALQFILSGQAGPGGRPIALASFLLDANNWPADPFPFKYTNLMLHLLTGVVLCWLAYLLARAMQLGTTKAAWVGTLTAGLWLLHPYFVSTVLYPVQRMAMLAALFMVAGLLLYAAGRLNLANGKAWAGATQITLGVGLFTPLAFFSKENGALLPLLALVMEATVLQKIPVAPALKRRFHIWAGLCLLLPVLIMTMHFALGWSHILAGYNTRPFTFTERLLTEPRILFDYLHHLVIPQFQGKGLFHDNYVISTSLLQPISTAFAMVGVLALLVVAWLWRKRYPVLALAVLFYFAGHIIESSFIALELYYEHRNYLPAMMLAFAAAFYLVALSAKAPKYGIPLAIIVLGLFTSFTYARSTLWGNMDKLGLVWATENPGSRRAQQQAAIILYKLGENKKALAHISTALRYRPEDAVLRLQAYLGHCGTSPTTAAELKSAKYWLTRNLLKDQITQNITNTINLKSQGHCPEVTYDDLRQIIYAILRNPTVQNNGGLIQSMLYLNARIQLLTDKPKDAFASLINAFKAAPTIDGAMLFTGLLASHKQYDDALVMLDKAQMVLELAKKQFDWRDKLLMQTRHFQEEITRIRKVILQQKAMVQTQDGH